MRPHTPITPVLPVRPGAPPTMDTSRTRKTWNDHEAEGRLTATDGCCAWARMIPLAQVEAEAGQLVRNGQRLDGRSLKVVPSRKEGNEVSSSGPVWNPVLWHNVVGGDCFLVPYRPPHPHKHRATRILASTFTHLIPQPKSVTWTDSHLLSLQHH